MSKEKIQSLTKYQTELKNKSESKDVPVKHKENEKTYRAFLANELRMVNSKIDSLKVLGIK